ncbi:hypothetical protein B1810_21415 [Panacagrimonas perspica]|nr:hypothetical protein B1810_21415 [Panacagrimonas perspica]
MLKRVLRWALLLAAIGVSVVLWRIGSTLVRPQPASIPERALGMAHEQVSFESASGSTLHGWYVPGSGKAGTVVLMHGARSNRLSMVNRARFLHRQGYAVLLFDFQAHGQSPGRHITMGYLEARDAAAAVDYARRRRPHDFIGAIGTSMGGAAAVLGREPLPVDALVLEAVYPDIQRALGNRLDLRFGPKGRWLAPLLLAQLPPRLGIVPGSLAPVHGIRQVEAPLLLIAGSKDRRTTVVESEALFAAAPEPKALWVVRGAGHVDFAKYAGSAYEQRVLSFFEQARRDALIQHASLH